MNKKGFADLIIISMVILIGMVIALWYKDTDIMGIKVPHEGNTVGAVTENNFVEQTFLSKENGLTRVDLLLGTYGRENTSNVYFELLDQQGTSFFKQTVNAASLKDNSFYTLDFDTVKDSKEKTYTVKITSDAQSGDNAITVWAANNDIYTDGELYLNGYESGFDISFQVFYSSNVVSKHLMMFSVLAFGFSIIIAVVYNIWLKNKANRIIKFGCWLFCAVLTAFSLTAAYNKCVLDLVSLRTVVSVSGLLRTLIFFAPSLLYTAFLFFDHNNIGDFVFTKRWIIAGVIFVIAVACNLNLSSVSMWNEYVQPGIRPELSEPIWGKARAIRSDEWLGSTPRAATAELVGYGAGNDIVRGTYNHGLAASGLYLSYSALSNPFKWGYYLFGFERGASFYWLSIFIVGFMSAFELCYIITKKKRLYALFGGAVIGLSQFIMWWSVSITWMIIPAIIVCIYYFCEAKKKYSKILFALGVVFSCSVFVVNLYPAWQVPLAYLLIAMVIWIFIEKWAQIKNFKKFEWLTVACAFVLLLTFVGSYLYDNSFYTERVMTTVYPGHRIGIGGWSLNKAFLFPQTLLYPIKDIGNRCEAGVFFSLFPIPFIISIANLVHQIKEGRKDKNIKIDILNILLLIGSIYLFIYCSVGFPEWLAKITLMSYSTEGRAIDILIYICSLLMIRNLAADKKERAYFSKEAALIISSVVAIYAIYVSNKEYSNYMTIEYIVFITICILMLSLALFNAVSHKYKRRIIATGIIGIALCGSAVNPITCGMSALKSKPAALAIQRIVTEDPDAKWASLNMGQYVIANGGSCINSVNYLPNLELWHKLDTTGEYEEVYNRYAHVTLNLTQEETSFTLIQADSIRLNLNYSDMEKCDIKYLTASSPVFEDSSAVDFELIYDEGGYYIYKVVYL
ncbi:MAG: hypothetical protein NC078_00420 [Ruminococcus sp.]|nr:hypothetical protein [Ruminococcus sp.]